MYDEFLEQRSAARAPIWRNAILYTPSAILVVLLLAVSIGGLLDGNVGAILPAVLLAVIAFALIYESAAAIRDLRTEPVTTRGEVGRVWKKSKLLVFGRQDYLLIDRKVFEIGPITATELQPGQVVSVQHWPHTMRVISVERVAGSSSEQS